MDACLCLRAPVTVNSTPSLAQGWQRATVTLATTHRSCFREPPREQVASRLPPETVGSDGSAVCAPRACSSDDAGHLRIPSAPHPLGTQTDSGGGFLFPCNTENYMRMYNVRGVVSQ